MTASAREGGFSAVQIADPQEASAGTLRRLADEGQEHFCQAPASTAHDDWFRTLSQLKKAARRRYSPPHSVPAELWYWVLQHATRELTGEWPHTDHLGERALDRARCRRRVPCPAFTERLRAIFRQFRAKTRTPYQWHWSRTFQLSKGNLKKGTKAMRLIHCYCPFGKAWYRGLFLRSPRPPLPPHAHGYAPHRCRQNAQLVAKIHSWRLRKLGISHLLLKKDMSNAFPSTSHEELARTVQQIIPHPQDRAFLHQRHSEAVMEIRAGEQTGYYQPTHGSGMGDGNA
eukprot:587102-Pyramimonas_sp.AAC.1